ncbi:MAG TPA: type II secretion system protein [Pseudomonadales bacterium]
MCTTVTKLRSCRGAPRDAGFSLIELAIVMMIVGTLMSGLLVAVSQSMANGRITDARAQLREIEEALYGYAQATGHLPCPANNGSQGYEVPLGSGDCINTHGFLPVSTLGLVGAVNGDGLLLDPWQNPYRYSVAPQECSACSGDRSFTSPSGLKEVFDEGTIAAADMIRVCDRSNCDAAGAVVHAETVPAIVYSMGANWATYASSDEVKNAGDGTTLLGSYRIKSAADLDFVSTTYSEDNFDDQLVWLSPYILFNRMVAAGKLP